MKQDLQDIDQLRQQAESELDKVSSAAQLETWRVAYIGRKGAVPQLLRQVKDLPETDRRQVGKLANELRRQLENAFAKKKGKFQQVESKTKTNTVDDVALAPGHPNPLTTTMRRLIDIFSGMGFLIVEGPEVEEAKYNFDQLNIPFEHPARAETDTFYVAKQKGNADLVLRTHVSPIQIRGVLENKLEPPFKMMYFGRCFRSEKTDATHENTFHQFEFMMVGQDLNMSDLKGVITKVYSTFFGKEIDIRFRPSYFPFVEPGFEVDVSCVFCGQKGCPVCKHTGWIEMAGAGMVHPNVLRNINVDPDKYTGLACGAAVDRLVMLRHNINDIRLFWSGDIRFLRQFS